MRARKSIVLLTIAAEVVIPPILFFCLAFPDSSIAEWTEMTESSSCSLLEHANRESKCLTMIHATSAGRG